MHAVACKLDSYKDWWWKELPEGDFAVKLVWWSDNLFAPTGSLETARAYWRKVLSALVEVGF